MARKLDPYAHVVTTAVTVRLSAYRNDADSDFLVTFEAGHWTPRTGGSVKVTIVREMEGVKSKAKPRTFLLKRLDGAGEGVATVLRKLDFAEGNRFDAVVKAVGARVADLFE